MCYGDLQLRTVPTVTNPRVENVSLTHNGLTSIGPASFAGLSKLGRLDLSSNQITTVDAHALADCTSLVSVTLNRNQLTRVPAALFGGLTKLRAVSMAYNYLTTLPEGLFSDTANITMIELAGNRVSIWPANLIRGLQHLEDFGAYQQQGVHMVSIPPGFYDDVPMMKYFYWGQAAENVVIPNGDLIRNLTNLRLFYLCCGVKDMYPETLFQGQAKLKQVLVWGPNEVKLAENMFADCAQLEELSFTSSGIESVPEGTFRGLANVLKIELGNNRITSLAAGLFRDCTLLKTLALANNRITMLPLDFLAPPLPHLTSLSTKGNILSCPSFDRSPESEASQQRAATTAEGGGGPSTFALSNCTCSANKGDNDLRYRLMDSSGIRTCEPTYLPGSPKCATATGLRGDASCSAGVCRTHCCQPGVPINCTLCNGVDGACYRPLALNPGWQAEAKLDGSNGWVERINEGELQTLQGPPPTFVGSSLANVENKSGSNFEYSLLWSANGAAAVVGQHPPDTLRGAGEQLDPGFMTLDKDTGTIYAVPKKRGTYTAWLVVKDLGGAATERGLDEKYDSVILKKWAFEVSDRRRLGINTALWNATAPGPNVRNRYQVGRVFEIPGPGVAPSRLFTNPAGGDPATVRYTFTVFNASAAATGGSAPNTTSLAPLDATAGKFFVAQTGEISLNVLQPGRFTAKLEAQDKNGYAATIREWHFEALRVDTSISANGPNGYGCGDGEPVDGAEFDSAFTCDCSATKYGGENCDREQGDQKNEAAAVIVGAVLGVMLLAAAVVFFMLRWQRHTRSMMATDFQKQLEAMKERGEVDEVQAAKGGVPRELKRGWLALVDKLGHGQFGDVWKGLLEDGGSSNVPAYMVACKVVKEALGSLDKAGASAAEEELLKEALLMAQVQTHEHLVSLVGVITRGSPKVLVLSFCEHGELQSALKKRAADGDAFSNAAKCNFCKEIADGMAHLAQHNFVHRDLAARNVLLGSGMVCKVADFGLSRRVQTEDNTGDYYRSSSGIIPVRWTAPEGMTSQKFSSASDVWSYGITCIEVFQDGANPYPGVKSNPEVITMVCAQGLVHPRPGGCSDGVYRELAKCWAFDPGQRPDFAGLKAFFLATAAQLHVKAPHGRVDGGGGGGLQGPGAAPAQVPQLHVKAPRADGGGLQGPGAALAQGGAALHYDLGHQDNTNGGASQHYTLGHQDAGAGAGAHYNLGYQDTGAAAPLLLLDDNDVSLASSAM